MSFAAVASSTPRTQRFAGAYQQVGVQTVVADASAHRLIELLFEGYFADIARARGALRSGDIATKGQAIGHAARIVEEGLKAALDPVGGGRLAADLADLYAYIGIRLTQANLSNDERILDECARLVAPLRDAWVAIGPQAATRN